MAEATVEVPLRVVLAAAKGLNNAKRFYPGQPYAAVLKETADELAEAALMADQYAINAAIVACKLTEAAASA